MGNQCFRPARGTKGRMQIIAPCPRETAKSKGARETNVPEKETTAVGRDREPLTSVALELRQEETVAAEH